MKKAIPRKKCETISVGGILARVYRSNTGGYESWLVRYYVDGKAKSLRATSLEEAKKKAKQVLADVSSGSAHVMSFSPREAANIAAAVEKLKVVGVPLLDAVTQFCDAHTTIGSEGTISEAARYFVADKERRKLKPIAVPDLVARFLHDKQEGFSSLYRDRIKSRLNKFAETFKCPIASVRTDEIAVWLNTINAKGRNGNNYRSDVCTLFSYARERGFLPRDKKTEVELLKRFKESVEDIGIYTPKEIRRLLGAASGPVQASIAIGAFAGLRNAEILRLDWRDVNLSAGRIVVSADKAKTAQRRIVPILPNLRSWLEPLAQKEGSVSPPFKNLTNLSRSISSACKRAGLQMVENGLRHSFASYRLASVQSTDQVALEMGNSPKEIFRSYRELVTPESAAAWFNVTPETPEAEGEMPENVISIGSRKIGVIGFEESNA